MVKTIKIGNKDVKLNANAATPILYRSKFNRDLMQDLYGMVDEPVAYETYCMVAYIMAMDAGEDVPEDYIEWVRGFDGLLDIVEALDEIMDVWERSKVTTVKAKKKNVPQSES